MIEPDCYEEIVVDLKEKVDRLFLDVCCGSPKNDKLILEVTALSKDLARGICEHE